MLKKIPSTEVKNRFGSVLREVAQTGEAVIVLRDGKPVAVILSVAEFEELVQRTVTKKGKAGILAEAFGLWADRADLADDWLAESRKEWESSWKNES